MHSLEVLVLNKSFAKTKRLRRLAAARAGAHSGLHLHGGEVLKAVNTFLARSLAMRILEIDAVQLGPPQLQALGAAMSARQEYTTLGMH